MPKATQLNLQLKNEPGTLANLSRDLANLGINLLALAAPDTSAQRGVIRLLVANPQLAQANMTKAGYKFTVEEVVYIEIKNRPGSLAKAMEKLARSKIAVRYAYATAFPKAHKTAAVLGVAEKDLPKAIKLLG